MTEQELASRDQHFSNYLPAIREIARSQGDEVPSWETIENNRKRFLQALPESSDLLIFAYGSLMWKPLLHYSNQYHAMLDGFRRHFCLDMPFFRGSPEKPGLMMALDTGGHCEGLCFRIPAKWVERETQVLWKRECCLDGYHPEWVVPKIAPEMSDIDEQIPCMTFVINSDAPRYLNDLDLEITVHKIQSAQGQFGNNREYFDNTLQHLRELNILDPELENIQQELTRQGL
ncbi:gamma-glutamylcyclotransferase [Endozoicomonas sp. OPT23]|uniref:gamma-glutamylcyclotransferase n=1 Tax=Endozoicomonas sp. OPT23 TaxID=2072845 RepID=UPI00129AE373|nr:gamma-glutamylcyclotransferase [Endozoicomonas sp. OPT23]MRI32630.1 gamma-glutamylcyclotransferase [Endozoicomonas sp. OPT23]